MVNGVDIQESNRRFDSGAEVALADFLDRYFYAYLKDYGYRWQRERGRDDQLLGIDGRLFYGEDVKNIDEKGAFHFFNSHLNTFAFELSSIQRCGEVDGWFVNEDTKTDYYLIVWPNGRCSIPGGERGWLDSCIRTRNKRILDFRDFTVVTAMLISRNKLVEKIESYGWDLQRLRRKAFEIRRNYAPGEKIKSGVDDFCFIFSRDKKDGGDYGYVEKPINLVVKKRLLHSIAKGVYLISEDGVGVIKDDFILERQGFRIYEKRMKEPNS
ncbi:hypothetical protein [Bifidobacterium stellenboschense]|uniref:Uncharacterized protein n=1 Tax=Bifidobacterium stellenboschense TaxID=762211 RepID=A0A087DJJ7_9BIFI|nr:hypothetical protein [Bifidobacterium stellenboschense]KFI95697.1 hypothetical protein BSTEL_0503 [Bifidobacterium stellenboschense]